MVQSDGNDSDIIVSNQLSQGEPVGWWMLRSNSDIIVSNQSSESERWMLRGNSDIIVNLFRINGVRVNRWLVDASNASSLDSVESVSTSRCPSPMNSRTSFCVDFRMCFIFQWMCLKYGFSNL